MSDETMPAMALLQDCLAHNPDHYDATRLAAAVATQNGFTAQSRTIMESFYDRVPYHTERALRLGNEPALLTIRGFSGTSVIPWVTNDGRATTRLRGGHFTAKFLSVNPSYPNHRFTIAAENILRPNAVPDFKLMLNTIADPDVEGETLKTLGRYLADCPNTPVINAPDQVLQTTRDANDQRLRGTSGVHFPQTHRVVFDAADASSIAAEITRLGLDDTPVILRQVGTHTARSTALIRTRADLTDYTAGGELTGDYYLIRYIEQLWRGEYFRKLRLFFIDGALYPVVCHIDKTWNVHGGNRKDLMRGNPALMAEEKRFLLDWRSYVGAANADRLERLAQDVGLDFFGIDFTTTDDGILIYEMNPAMRHSFDHAEDFSYKLPFDMAISQAFTAMIETRLSA